MKQYSLLSRKRDQANTKWNDNSCKLTARVQGSKIYEIDTYKIGVIKLKEDSQNSLILVIDASQPEAKVNCMLCRCCQESLKLSKKD